MISGYDGLRALLLDLRFDEYTQVKLPVTSTLSHLPIQLYFGKKFAHPHVVP